MDAPPLTPLPERHAALNLIVGISSVTPSRARSRDTSVAIDHAHVWTIVGLVAVTALAFAVRFAAFSKVPGDPFYDGAVRSMGQSWHNFFFGAYEPSAQVSVDKLPFDLWLQVASTKLFGFSSSALRLPEALAGALTVPLLFDTVRRMFGRVAGLVAGLALAVLPLAILTSRSDTMDSLMVALLVGAAWLVVRSVQTSRILPMIGAGAVVGLAFNVKLYEAYLVVPALVGLAVFASTMPWRRLLLGLAGAGAALVVVSVAWIVAATAAPGSHPWPIGSTDGTVWNDILYYNGIDRVTKTGSTAASAIDPVGPLRLFGGGGVHYGSYIGTALVAAIVLGVAALAYAAPRLWRDGSPAGRLRRGGVAWIVLWLLVGVALFSEMGRLHLRYVEAISPAVAAAIGVAVATLVAGARRGPLAAWLLAAAATVTALLVTVVPPTTNVAAEPYALAGAAVTVVAALALTVWRGKHALAGRGILAAGALVAVLALPVGGAVGVVGSARSDSGAPGYMPPSRLVPLSAYLRANQGSARYEVAMSTVIRAGALVARDGRPVLMLTSVYALPLVTANEFASLVHTGQVKYVLTGRAECVHSARSTCPPAMRWAFRHGTDVSAAAGQKPGQLLRVGDTVTPSGAKIPAQPTGTVSPPPPA